MQSNCKVLLCHFESNVVMIILEQFSSLENELNEETPFINFYFDVHIQSNLQYIDINMSINSTLFIFRYREKSIYMSYGSYAR